MVAIVTKDNVGVPSGVAPLDANSAVPVSHGGTGVTSLPDGALHVEAGVVKGGPLPPSAGGTGTITSTGSGANVLADGPTLSAPIITGGAINGTTLGALLPVSVVASSVDTQSLTVNGVTTSSFSGSGSIVMSLSPTLVTPDLGIPTHITLTNATGLPLDTGTTGVLPVAKGGTGASSLTGIVKGNGAGPFTAAVAGVDYLAPGTVGQPGGIASLGADGKLSTAQIPDSLVGALNYQGVWDADTNTPDLLAASSAKGHYYKVSVAGTTDLNGLSAWNVGDLVIFDGTEWGRVDGSPDSVLSVNGLTGAVVLSPATIGAAKSGVNSDITELQGLATPLTIEQGGTGTATATGTGDVVLAYSPTLITPNLDTPSAVTLTNATGLPLETGVTGVLGLAHGGTGAVGAQGARNSIAGVTTAGYVMRADGTNVSMSPLLAADIPLLNQNTTGSAATVSSPNQPAITSVGTLSGVNVQGALTLVGATSPLIATGGAGASGQVLTSGGPGTTPFWSSVSGAGTVTSVDIDGRGTGLTFSGGPITSSGILELDGVLNVSAGGTGVTTSTGTGSNVLSTNAVLVTPDLGTPSRLILSNATGLSLASGVTGNLSIAQGGTGATTAAAARSNIGAAMAGTNTDITSLGGLVVPITVAQGGTGVTTSTGTGANVLSTSPSFTGTVQVANLNINGSAILAGTSAPLILNDTPGTAGQVLTSGGAGATPTWTTLAGAGTVTSVQASGGTTGLTFSGGPVTTSGTLTLAGTLSASNGGTGINSYAVGDIIYAASTNALAKLPDVAVGQVLLSGGVGAAPSYGKVALATHVSGTLPVTNGGTGVTTSTGTGSVVLRTAPTITNPVLSGGTLNNSVIGGTTAAAGTFTALAARTSLTLSGAAVTLSLNGSTGTSGQVLTSQGGVSTPTWTSVGTMTSVDASGGTTGLTFTGGPITTSGTLTLGGTLAVASGGTGATTTTGTGANVLANNSNLQGTTQIAKASVAGGITLAGTASPLVLNSTPGTAGQVLISQGPDTTPAWQTVTGSGTVTSVQASGGTTGLTFSGGPITGAGTLTLGGTLAPAAGGTGTTTSTGTGSNVLSVGPTLTGTTTVSGINISGTLAFSGAQGTAGQVLMSGGAGNAPVWAAPPGSGSVTSVDVSGGTTGLTVSGGPITTSGTFTLGGSLAIAAGGTGATAVTGTGSNVLSDGPVLTGTAKAASLEIDTALSLTGGTSAMNLNGSSGTAGQVLTSAGPGVTPSWATLTGMGTVTSVQASGGTTGLTFSGGPVVDAGTLTLGGTLTVANGGTGLTSIANGELLVGGSSGYAKIAPVATGSVLISNGTGVAPVYGKVTLTTHVTGTLPVANGGTGVTTSTGSGNAVLSNNPKLVTPDLGTPSALVLSNATGLPLTTGVAGQLPVANGGTGATAVTGTGNNVLSASPTLTGTTNVANLTAAGTVSLSGANSPLLLNTAPGTAGQVLTSSGTGSTPTWTTITTGSVSSVQASGGTTGMSFTGGPITTSGTLTLTGTLAIANGGTGATTATGTGANVLAVGPTLTGTTTVNNITAGGTANFQSMIQLSGSSGTSGQALVSQGTGAPIWKSLVSSVAGGTTGLTFSGSDVLTMAGTLAVANGGTGATAVTGTGSNVLNTNALVSGQRKTVGAITASSTDYGVSVISNDVTVVSTDGTPKAVTLPAIGTSTGRTLELSGSGSAADTVLIVFPNTADSIDGLGNGASITVPLNSTLVLVAYAANKWRTSRVNAAGVTGILPVDKGGTGVTTATGSGSVVLSDSPNIGGLASVNALSVSGNFSLNSSLVTAASAGNVGQILSSNGAGAAPQWIDPPTSTNGTVTSVEASGGSTGLTFSGGPITGSGTLTLGGNLEVANGGTGSTTVTGSGANVLAVGPSLTSASLEGTTTSTGIVTTYVNAGAITSPTSSMPSVTHNVPVSDGSGSWGWSAVNGILSFSSSNGISISKGTGNNGFSISGTLAVARGGTGSTSVSGTGSNVLNSSPSIYSPLVYGGRAGVQNLSSGTAINIASGDIVLKTITGNTTLSITSPLSGQAFILELTMSTVYTVSLWANIKWDSGTAPTLVAGTTCLGFWTPDGTNWRGVLLSQAIA